LGKTGKKTVGKRNLSKVSDRGEVKKKCETEGQNKTGRGLEGLVSKEPGGGKKDWIQEEESKIYSFEEWDVFEVSYWRYRHKGGIGTRGADYQENGGDPLS